MYFYSVIVLLEYIYLFIYLLFIFYLYDTNYTGEDGHIKMIFLLCCHYA